MAARIDSNHTRIRTAGEVFPDGSALELLRDPSSAEKLTLVRFDHELLEVGSPMPGPNGVYTPIAVHPSFAAAIRFPNRVGPPESPKRLFADVHELLLRHTGQLDSCVTALAFTVFASWLAPVLEMVPMLSIFAPPGSCNDVVMKLMGLLCRRPLRLPCVKRGDLRRLPMRILPTLLLDEPDLHPATLALLRASTHRGSFVTGPDGLQDLFGLKIICASTQPSGPTWGSNVLGASLIPVSGSLPPFDKMAQEEIATNFQARFLGYFLRNFNRVEMPKFDVSRLEQPVQALARTLGAVVIGDDDLQAKILPLLKIQDEEIRANRARDCDAVVLEALLFFIHQGGWTKVHTTTVADKVGAIYKGRGDDQSLSPESVGWAIRRVGVPSGRINRAGNGVELNASACRLIHRLARSYGVRALEGALREDCQYCTELQSNAPMPPGAGVEDVEVAEDFRKAEAMA
jgi:hypothetical protein